jgi:hypothetical protein
MTAHDHEDNEKLDDELPDLQAQNEPDDFVHGHGRWASDGQTPES